MSAISRFLPAICVLILASPLAQQSAACQTDSQIQTLHTGTQLVVLDATVFDKSGHIVTQPLHKEDFVLEEDKQPQLIRSFEAPPEHLPTTDGTSSPNPPVTIVILDELNSRYVAPIGDKANLMNLLGQQVYLRTQLVDFLARQPALLTTPTEVLALTHHGFGELVPTTRDRDHVIALVKAHDPGLGSPWRDYIEETGAGGIPDNTLTKGSMAALWALALQQRSQPGRKNVIWLGWGGPARLSDARVDPKNLTNSQRYVRQITDLLVAARITLNVMGPGVGAGSDVETRPTPGQLQIESYNFEGDFGFSGYVSASGGRIRNGNDVTGEIDSALASGQQYYTLSYRPENGDFDGRFRRIRLSVIGHPDWFVLTKAGYYALQFGGERDPSHELQSDLSIATFEASPFHAIGATLTSIQRIRGTDSARFTLKLQSDDLEWLTDTDSGQREADVAVSAAALGSVFAKQPLHSQVATWKLTSSSPSSFEADTTVTVTAHIPPRTQRVRFVVRDMANGRMGTVDLNPAEVARAPLVSPAPPAPLQPR